MHSINIIIAVLYDISHISYPDHAARQNDALTMHSDGSIIRKRGLHGDGPSWKHPTTHTGKIMHSSFINYCKSYTGLAAHSCRP